MLGREDFGFGGESVEFTDLRPVDMPMKTSAGAVRRNIRLQAGGRFKPIAQVVARRAVASLVNMVGVVADVVFARVGNNRRPTRAVGFGASILWLRWPPVERQPISLEQLNQLPPFFV